jgi:DNA-nicking Smr family endonuclease
MTDDADSVEFPIDGIIDLHTFDPKDVRELIPDYIEACLEKGLTELKIIHGKGTGTLRRIVHSILEKRPDVESFRLDPHGSSWGATLVNLRKNKNS